MHFTLDQTGVFLGHQVDSFELHVVCAQAELSEVPLKGSFGTVAHPF